MSEPQPNFPPNVVLYIRNEINRRTAYKAELEQTPMPPEFKLVEVERYRSNMIRLQGNIQQLTQDIIAITKKYFPSIEVDPNNDELTITAVLNVLPPPEAVRHPPTLISSRGK